jgi:hypothetical protein
LERVFELDVIFVASRPFLLQILLKGFHYFGLMLRRMIDKFQFIQKSQVSQIDKEFLTGLEALEVSVRVKSIKDQNVIDIVTDNIFKLDMLMVGTADNPCFI